MNPMIFEKLDREVGVELAVGDLSLARCRVAFRNMARVTRKRKPLMVIYSFIAVSSNVGMSVINDQAPFS